MIDTSVVLPVGPRVAHLDEQLKALARQETDLIYEVIVVDNAAKSRRWDLPSDRFRVVHACDRMTPGYARNAGAAHAHADVILFCDADDVVSTEWVDAMSRVARHADVFGGPIDELRLDPLRDERAATASVALPRDLHLMPWFIGANMGMRAEAFAVLRGWDDRYRAAEEIDLCWRAQIAGFRLASAPDALVFYRPRATSIAAFSQGWAWGFAAPRLLRRYRCHGLRSPSFRDAAKDWTKLAFVIPRLPLSRRLRRDWARLFGLRLGRAIGSVRWRRVLL